MNQLVELLERAGHVDFRDARGPMGFTQRQAGGKFTRDEAQEYIDRLEQAEAEALEAAEAQEEPEVQEEAAPELPDLAEVTLPLDVENALRGFSSEDLAAELRRRGRFVGDD